MFKNYYSFRQSNKESNLKTIESTINSLLEKFSFFTNNNFLARFKASNKKSILSSSKLLILIKLD